MRITIDARESGTSTGRYIDKLIEYLAKTDSGFEFSVITKPHRLEYIKQIAPKFKVIESDIKEFTFAEQLKLLSQLNSMGSDLVHFGMVQQPILYRGKSITTIHDLTTVRFTNPDKNPLVFKIKQIVLKYVIKSAARKSITVIAPTKFVKDDLIKFTHQPAKKFVVTYEAADKISDALEPVKKLEGKSFIMYVGRPTPHKNLEKLIEAFSIISVKRPELFLVLAGKKDLNYTRIENRAKSKGIKNVIFTDFISDGQLRWLYENCRAYIVASLSEGFGLPGLEAMANGAPVVSSNATCLPEVYGEAAKYFDPYDEYNMVKAILEVIENDDLRGSLIQMGHMQVKKYSWKTMTEQTLEIYKKALG